MRFTTRDLFVVLAFTAVLALCAGQTGFIHPFYWITLVVSFVLGWIFVRWADNGVGAIAAIVASAFCAMCVGTVATVVVGGLLLLSAIVCRNAPPISMRGRCYIAMGCIAAGVSLSMLPGYFELRRLEKMRRDYPIESLHHRLAYEENASRRSIPPLHPAVAQRLSTVESTAEEMSWRGWQLERIHRRQSDQFARAAGFGPVRMVQPRLQAIEESTLRDVAFERSPTDGAIPADDLWRTRRPSSLDAVNDVHEASSDDFLHPEGYGGIISPRTEVAGFVEHAFHRHPLNDATRPKWSIDRLELVSLLKFDEPRVYVLDHLPRMDQLSSDTAPTRELNEFEASALEKLRLQEDLVVHSEAESYQMLGSLRAAKQCLDCHNVQRGELLGAFSYRLTLAEDDSELESELVAKDPAPTERPDSSLRSE
jgi:hypothetical protein